MTDLEKIFTDMFRAKEQADDELRKNFEQVSIIFGDYAMWNVSSEKVGITNTLTGEAGVFTKADLEPYIKHFFNTYF
jgi:hypothetical protein